MKLLNKNKDKSNEYEFVEDEDILDVSEKVSQLPKHKRNLKKPIAIIIAVALLAGGGGYAYYYKNSQANKQNEELVSREREYFVEKGDIVAGVDGSGKLKLERITQNFEGSVTIDKIYVKEGQRIKKGDKIASFSTKKINEELNTLYKQLKEINKQEKESESNEQANIDNNQLNDGMNMGSKEEIKKRIANLEKLKKSPVLYAKCSGIVDELGYEEGQETSSEKAVVTIAEDGDMYADISVSQDDILKLEEGQKTKIWVSTYEGDTFTGKISFINYKANTENGSTNYSVTIKLDDSDYELLDGMSITTQFIFKEINDATILSNKAITLKDGKQVVKIKQEDGTLTEKEITTGFSDGKVSEILSGLKEGDVVIVGGQ